MFVCVLVALLLVAGWGLYMLGRAHGSGPDWRFETVQRPSPVDDDNLRAANWRLRAENRRLSRQLAGLRQSTEVDQYASSELRDALGRMQARLSELKKELAFYRNIVSPKTGDIGARVQNLTVARAGKPDLYDLQFTLIRSMGYEGELSGQVQITLRGLRDGEPVDLAWTELALDPSSELVFSFQYYQRLGGAFRLPEDIHPIRLAVEVDPEADGTSAVTKNYRWTELIASQP